MFGYANDNKMYGINTRATGRTGETHDLKNMNPRKLPCAQVCLIPEGPISRPDSSKHHHLHSPTAHPPNPMTSHL
jgi:hypothetical protein